MIRLFGVCLLSALCALAQETIIPDAHLRQGQVSLRNGDLIRAEQELKTATQLMPHTPAAWHLLGITEVRLGKPKEGRELMLKAIELDPDDSETYNDVGIVELQLGLNDAALADFKRSLDLNDRSAVVYYNFGRALLQLQRYPEAVAAFEKGHTLSPADPDMLYGLVSGLVQIGDGTRLQELLPAIQSVFRENSDVHVRLAHAFFEKQLYMQAAAEFAFASKLNPGERSHLAYEEAEADYRAGEFRKALDLLTDMVSAGSRDARLLRLRGSILGATHSFAEASQQFREAIRIDPQNPENYVAYGKLLLDAHDPEDAIALFQTAAKKFPEDYRVMLGLGMAYKENHQHAQALDALAKAITIAPERSSAYSIKGFVLTSLGRHAEAREAYHRAIQLNAHDYLAPYFCAVDLDREGGDDAEKLSLLDQSVKINPRFALAYFEVGKICLHSGALARAQEALQTAIEIDPGLEQAHYLLGKVHQRTGNVELATREFDTFNRMRSGKLSSQTELKEELVLEGAAARSALESASP